MADNFTFTEGAGKSGAADDVGGVLFAKVKLDLGTDGASAPALAGAGAVATGVQRITLASDDPAVVLLTTIDSDTNTIQTDTTSIDGKITACNTGAVVLSSGTVTTVSTVTNLAQLGGTAITMDEGVHDAGCQRITMATDDDSVGYLATIAGDTTSMDGNITACNTGAVVLSSGTVTTVSTVTNLAQMGGAALAMNEGALGVGVQRVTLATDDDAVAYLATIAGDTTSMDGNITACNTGAVVISSGTITTVSTVTSLSQLGGQAINLGEGTIDTGTQRVSLATDDDAVASLGVIDDWDATHDSAASADGVQLMAAYDATKPTAVADGDAVRVLADEYGRLLSGVEKTAWHATLNSADATGAAVVVKASAASTILVIQSYVISSDIEGWAHLVDEDDTVLTGKFWLKAGGGVAITLPDKAPIMMGVDKDLEFRCEAAGDVSVSATGYTIPG
jgi:hypothetical protein